MRRQTLQTSLGLAMGVIGLAAAIDGRAGAAPMSWIATGTDHSCAVRAGGVQCWGGNDYGQLGDGTSVQRTYPVYVHGLPALGQAIAVAAGFRHSCAVVDGGLKCWGDNEDGQLGVAGLESSNEPVEVFPPRSGVTDVIAGSRHTCAIVNTALQCWGSNVFGQVGSGDIDPVLPEPVVVIAGGVGAAAGGAWHTCAIVDGALKCWGRNDLGQLGIGSDDPMPQPEDVALDGFVTDVAAAAAHTCAVVDQERVFCWGNNVTSQLGNGNFTSSNVPVQVQNLGGSGFMAAVAAGGDDNIGHSCALIGDEPYCWGANTQGQLGNGSLSDSSIPVSSGLSGVFDIAANYHHTCVTNMAGDTVRCAGNDSNGQIGDHGAPTYVMVPTSSMPLGGFETIAGGNAHGCGIRNGDAYCWGENRYGQLGRGDLIADAWPAVVESSVMPGAFEGVGVGDRHSCAVLMGGNVQCWGGNDHGQLGDGTTTQHALPIEVSVSGATQIAAGTAHTCTVLSSGGVRCWGLGSSGQLGHDALADSSTPLSVLMPLGQFHVELSDATQVTAGTAHSCATTSSGVRCWGSNSQGQLGIGNTTDSDIAVLVEGVSQLVEKVVAGSAFTCALEDGTVSCWGDNSNGQLGNGVGQGNELVPTSVLVGPQDTLVGASAITAGQRHACAVVNGGVSCWGDNGYAQIGEGDKEGEFPYATSTLAPGLGITGIAAGAFHTCAWSGVLTWCWGYGQGGRMGNGSLGYSPHFVIADSLFVSGVDEIYEDN